MIVRFYNRVGRSLITECIMKYPPSESDHVNLFGGEFVVTGRLFELDGTVKIFVRKATSNDVTYM